MTTPSGVLNNGPKEERIIPKIVAYLSCSAGRTHFVQTKTNIILQWRMSGQFLCYQVNLKQLVRILVLISIWFLANVTSLFVAFPQLIQTSCLILISCQSQKHKSSCLSSIFHILNQKNKFWLNCPIFGRDCFYIYYRVSGIRHFRYSYS